MTSRCSVCGSEEDVEYIYDSFSVAGEYRCSSCVNKGFPPGARIVKFVDKSHPLKPAYFLNIESESDLDLLMDVGTRAQRSGVNCIEACFYTAKGKRVGPSSFTLGHPSSLNTFRERVDQLRVWLATSEVLPKTVP
ncbi:hypothetical protein EU546_01485 [Candidatus Thorarchaeota archaeon]|nr:MAG: hypothetical protein EU546_01485 [Candidatus Thorarchaeota archaeon]